MEPTCICGTCLKCKHRKNVQERRKKDPPLGKKKTRKLTEIQFIYWLDVCQIQIRKYNRNWHTSTGRLKHKRVRNKVVR